RITLPDSVIEAIIPPDTIIDTTIIPPDTTIIPSDTIWRKLRFKMTDSVTLITNVVKIDQFDFDFHLPFDSTGQVYPLIWNMWLDDNLEQILADSSAINPLDSVKMWIATTPEWQFGNYREQTLSWIETLRTNGLDSLIEVYEYTGYPGNPATDNRYIYDVMREMLIFHSNVFKARMQ
ncbi:MAG: hypothetical protein AB1744_13850, partial [Candidatus Zixiibacteriota bacterium]